MSTDPIPDVMVLAAIERAERHRGHAGVPVWLIFEHLGIPRRSRKVRVQLQALVQAGAVKRFRAYGTEQWTLTSNGRRRLRRTGPLELPESPQHQEWRKAKALAAREIGRIQQAQREVITRASTLFEGEANSDQWFELAEQSQFVARQLGSVTYCLNEWAEPTDDRADIDDRCDPGDEQLEGTERQRRKHRRAGRRNTRRWTDASC